MAIAADRTQTIRASVADVQRTLLLSMVLVVAVIFLFLRNVRATLIPAVALPLSLIGTFGIMDWFCYGLDNLSLMALTVASGFRGRRRDRDDRECGALYRDGDETAGGRLPRSGTDRLYDRLADHLADRGVHPAAVHGWGGGAAVQ